MRIFVSGCIFLAITLGGNQFVAKNSFVPDANTAVRVAEAVLTPVFGKKQIESERPFTAQLEGEKWIVSGTLSCPDGKGRRTTSCVGGVAGVEISKSDARILSMTHGK